MWKADRNETEYWIRKLKKTLLADLLGFWKTRTADSQYGGYITAFDRVGNVMSREKNIWLQARQLWMFSEVYRKIDQNQVWLTLAKQGRDYIVNHAYAGHGNWNYLLDECGTILEGHISLYTDMFVLMGLSAYAAASGCDGDLSLIEKTFDSLWTHMDDNECTLTFPQEYHEGYVYHGLPMICINAAAYAGEVLKDERVDQLICKCMDTVFHVLGAGENGTIHEVRKRDGTGIESEEGHRINPGHVFESMWFVLQQAERLGRPDYRKRALQVIDSMYEESHDKVYGGILHMLDDRGFTGVYHDWNTERCLKWDEKVWWTHAEALCALLMSSVMTGNRQQWVEFQELFQWCETHFLDRENGEWYAVLKRDGTPRICHKGGLQKSAFHVPRAMYQCILLLEEIEVD